MGNRQNSLVQSSPVASETASEHKVDHTARGFVRMIDRNGRIVFGALLVLVLILTVSAIAEFQYGFELSDYPLLSFLLFAGVAVVAPQLYLAMTDDHVPPRSRIQFAAVTTAVFAIVFAGIADGVRSLLIAAIGTCALFGLISYEVLIGYRATGDESPTRAP